MAPALISPAGLTPTQLPQEQQRKVQWDRRSRGSALPLLLWAHGQGGSQTRIQTLTHLREELHLRRGFKVNRAEELWVLLQLQSGPAALRCSVLGCWGNYGLIPYERRSFLPVQNIFIKKIYFSLNKCDIGKHFVTWLVVMRTPFWTKSAFHRARSSGCMEASSAQQSAAWPSMWAARDRPCPAGCHPASKETCSRDTERDKETTRNEYKGHGRNGERGRANGCCTQCPLALCDGENSTVLILRKKTSTLIRKRYRLEFHKAAGSTSVSITHWNMLKGKDLQEKDLGVPVDQWLTSGWP